MGKLYNTKQTAELLGMSRSAFMMARHRNANWGPKPEPRKEGQRNNIALMFSEESIRKWQEFLKQPAFKKEGA